MSQNIFDTIVPSVTSGNQLATLLNDLKEALMSGQSGTTRPSQTLAGGYWVDTSLEISNNVLIHKLYDGAQDIEVFRVNKLTGKASFGSAQGTFEIAKITDDSIGPVLKFLKKRLTGTGQTLTGDIVGDADYYAVRDDSVEEVVARVRVSATDNVTSSAKGSNFSIFTTKTGTSTLTERLKIANDGKTGIGTSSPQKQLHVSANNSTDSGIISETVGDFSASGAVSLKKKRLSGSGQVLDNDSIGSYEFKSTDNTGADIVVAKIETIATQNHTTANHGSKLIISTKIQDSTLFQEAIVIESGKVTILGQDSTVDAKSKIALEDDSVTRNLFSVDGAVYGSFEISANILGNDGVDVFAQNLKIKGIYDFDNTSWFVSEESTVMNTNGQPSVVVDIPSYSVENLVVNYVNQIASFVSGTIYLDIRRNKR